jgi:murein L,D-transpeptidase YcbB/YkuD
VKGFQERHGLNPNGKVDEATLGALNVPVSRRIAQINLNLERLRWLPDELGQGVPDGKRAGLRPQNHEERPRGPADARGGGQRTQLTPIFRDTMEYIVFSPDWTVPRSIATKEILPIANATPTTCSRTITRCTIRGMPVTRWPSTR